MAVKTFFCIILVVKSRFSQFYGGFHTLSVLNSIEELSSKHNALAFSLSKAYQTKMSVYIKIMCLSLLASIWFTLSISC